MLKHPQKNNSKHRDASLHIGTHSHHTIESNAHSPCIVNAKFVTNLETKQQLIRQ